MGFSRLADYTWSEIWGTDNISTDKYEALQCTWSRKELSIKCNLPQHLKNSCGKSANIPPLSMTECYLTL